MVELEDICVTYLGQYSPHTYTWVEENRRIAKNTEYLIYMKKKLMYVAIANTEKNTIENLQLFYSRAGYSTRNSPCVVDYEDFFEEHRIGFVEGGNRH